MKVYVEQVDDVNIRIFSEDGIERELSNFFTFEIPGAKFMPAYKARLWDGKIRMYDLQRKTLYAGLYNYVRDFCERNEYTLIPTRNEHYKPLKINSYTNEQVGEFADSLELTARGKPIEIRDYQIDAIQNCLNSNRSLLLSPTASGKSLIIYTLMRHHIQEGRKCILIVPTTSLVEQMYTDFEDYSYQNGWPVDKACQKLYSGFTRDFTKDVLITTWQSIYKQPKTWFAISGICWPLLKASFSFHQAAAAHFQPTVGSLHSCKQQQSLTKQPMLRQPMLRSRKVCTQHVTHAVLHTHTNKQTNDPSNQPTNEPTNQPTIHPINKQAK
jgi:hypothetical protein